MILAGPVVYDLLLEIPVERHRLSIFFQQILHHFIFTINVFPLDVRVPLINVEKGGLLGNNGLHIICSNMKMGGPILMGFRGDCVFINRAD